MNIRLLDGNTVETALPFPPLIRAIEEAFRGGMEAPPRSHFDTGSGAYLVMPAWGTGSVVGSKLVTIQRGNREKGLPTIHGLYVLFSETTGEPLAVMDGRILTLKRTAATSALAARRMSRPESRTHLMIGAGALAPYLVDAIAAVRSIERVILWNRTTSRARVLAETLRSRGHTVEIADSVSEAVSQADIISTATQSESPIVLGADLSHGTHLDLVGAYTPDMAEADGAALRGAHIVVDTWDGAKAEAGDLIRAVAEDAISWDAVAGDLHDLVSGQIEGRVSETDTTVFKSVGASIEDLAAAKLAWETCISA